MHLVLSHDDFQVGEQVITLLATGWDRVQGSWSCTPSTFLSRSNPLRAWFLKFILLLGRNDDKVHQVGAVWCHLPVVFTFLNNAPASDPICGIVIQGSPTTMLPLGVAAFFSVATPFTVLVLVDLPSCVQRFCFVGWLLSLAIFTFCRNGHPEPTLLWCLLQPKKWCHSTL